LQVLDDGRLTDGHGRTVDFRNTVIIMTSNIGSQYIAASLGARGHVAQAVASDGGDGPQRVPRSAGIDDNLRRQVMDALKQEFRPEFLNRVDEVILFQSLSRDEIRRIVDLQLRYLERTLADQHLRLEVTPAARDLIAEEGYDPVYGARPLKRVIQQQIQNPLSLRILEGDYAEGATVRVDAKDGEFVFGS
jgi:ATP-dependent Clp protease ATP-binding subunit ClpB